MHVCTKSTICRTETIESPNESANKHKRLGLLKQQVAVYYWTLQEIHLDRKLYTIRRERSGHGGRDPSVAYTGKCLHDIQFVNPVVVQPEEDHLASRQTVLNHFYHFDLGAFFLFRKLLQARIHLRRVLEEHIQDDIPDAFQVKSCMPLYLAVSFS